MRVNTSWVAVCYTIFDMSKKDKELKRLRRKIEVLRAQAKGAGGVSVPSEPLVPFEPSSSHIQTDLRRSLLITAVILAAIGGLKASQPYWHKIVGWASKITPF